MVRVERWMVERGWEFRDDGHREGQGWDVTEEEVESLGKKIVVMTYTGR